ncbi:conserved hypothetical protein [Ricinus communis]|uniref:Uncharacterized protein n=1 Tax=Ricinus communis TaxID=3988 RepID=B9RIM7_RICCO|nr:conserved hypothetical protein [Ricinus communis]
MHMRFRLFLATEVGPRDSRRNERQSDVEARELKMGATAPDHSQVLLYPRGEQ